MLLKAVFASRLYQFFVQAAPGLRELMMLGKIYYEAERKDSAPPHRRVIIVDAPASGQAMNLLKMPTAARTTFADSVVGKEASNISRMLRDRRHCAIVQVTTADALSVAETIETHAELSRIHLAPAAVVFNRMVVPTFSPNDIAALKNRRVPRNRKKNLEHLAEIAESELRRVAEARKALATIRTATASPLIEIPEHRSPRRPRPNRLHSHRPGPRHRNRSPRNPHSMNPQRDCSPPPHSVSKKYLPLYLAEFQFRLNNRKEADIFGKAIAGC